MILQGYGIVRFSSKEEAKQAIADFHGTELEGRALAVKVDKCISSSTKCTPLGHLCACLALRDVLKFCISSLSSCVIAQPPLAQSMSLGVVSAANDSCKSPRHDVPCHIRQCWAEAHRFLILTVDTCAGLCEGATSDSYGRLSPGLR